MDATTVSITKGGAMTINLHDFTHYLDNQGLTEERKLEIVETVYLFLQERLDYELGIHPLQCCGYDQNKDSSAIRDDQYLSNQPAANDNEFEQKERA